MGEHQRAGDVGLLTAAQADAVWREGEAVIADVEAQRYPFDRDWSGWRPDPSWSDPSLPHDWAVLG